LSPSHIRIHTPSAHTSGHTCDEDRGVPSPDFASWLWLASLWVSLGMPIRRLLIAKDLFARLSFKFWLRLASFGFVFGRFRHRFVDSKGPVGFVFASKWGEGGGVFSRLRLARRPSTTHSGRLGIASDIASGGCATRRGTMSADRWSPPAALLRLSALGGAKTRFSDPKTHVRTRLKEPNLHVITGESSIYGIDPSSGLFSAI
jgi:hypothetical protein